MTETPQPAPSAPYSEAEERSQAKLLHILNGFFPAVGALIFWLIGKDRSALIDRQGKAALSWGIWVLIAYTVGLALCVVPGLVVWGYAIYLGFKAADAAGKGEDYQYPTWLPQIIK